MYGGHRHVTVTTLSLGFPIMTSQWTAAGRVSPLPPPCKTAVQTYCAAASMHDYLSLPCGLSSCKLRQAFGGVSPFPPPCKKT